MKYDKTKDRAGTDEQFPYPMKLEYNKETDLFIVTVYKLPKTKTEAGIRDLYPNKQWLSDSVDYPANVQGYWKLALVIEGEAPNIIRYPKYSLKLGENTYPYRTYKYERIDNPNGLFIRPCVGDVYGISFRLSHGQSEMKYYVDWLYSHEVKDPEDAFPYTAKFRANLRLMCFGEDIEESENGYRSFGQQDYRTKWYSNTITIDDIPINVE